MVSDYFTRLYTFRKKHAFLLPEYNSKEHLCNIQDALHFILDIYPKEFAVIINHLIL